MTIAEAKKYLYRHVSGYYGEGHVFYAGQKMPRFPEPYITIKFRKVRKQGNKITKFDGKEECYKDYWAMMMPAEINLYTQGKNISEPGKTPVYENTALEDLENFMTYLCSDYEKDEHLKNNIAIEQEGDVEDVSALVNDNSTFNFRSMVNVNVKFISCSYGKYGQLGIGNIPNTSGGGSEGLLEASDIIEEVNIKGGFIDEQ